MNEPSKSLSLSVSQLPKSLCHILGTSCSNPSLARLAFPRCFVLRHPQPASRTVERRTGCGQTIEPRICHRPHKAFASCFGEPPTARRRGGRGKKAYREFATSCPQLEASP